MYANGVGADFELYNAKTGIQYTDLESAKDSNTAYRFSWMNATASEKVFSIVAVYNSGEEKVIETIRMAPGTDAVAIGIVEVAEGQTVKLYARNDSKDAPAEDKGENGSNTDKPKSSNSVLLIVAIVGGVVLLALIAVAAVLVLKKPAAKAEPQEATDEKPNNEPTE